MKKKVGLLGIYHESNTFIHDVTMCNHRKDQIKILADTDYYTEGPAIDAEGNIYYTTLTGGRIMKIAPDGSSSVWAETPRPNGHRILLNGDHLVCESKLGKVVRFDRSGNRIEDAACGECEGKTIQTPNDLAVDEDSGFYFTDSIRHSGSVYFFGMDGSRSLIVTGIDYPNGICLSPDKTKLFVAESYKNRIIIMELKGPGVTGSPPHVFCKLPRNPENKITGNLPDGILMDDEERLWVAHYGMQSVHVISADGELITSYDTGIPLTSNICFTKDKNGLIVTGGRGEPGPGNVHLLPVNN